MCYGRGRQDRPCGTCIDEWNGSSKDFDINLDDCTHVDETMEFHRTPKHGNAPHCTLHRLQRVGAHYYSRCSETQRDRPCGTWRAVRPLGCRRRSSHVVCQPRVLTTMQVCRRKGILYVEARFGLRTVINAVLRTKAFSKSHGMTLTGCRAGRKFASGWGRVRALAACGRWMDAFGINFTYLHTTCTRLTRAVV